MYLQLILLLFLCFRYGMRYMAKVMYNALRTKFPKAPEKDVLKVYIVHPTCAHKCVTHVHCKQHLLLETV